MYAQNVKNKDLTPSCVRVGCVLSVEVGVEIVTDAIPYTIRITFSTMVVFAIMKTTLVGYGFL